MKGFHIMSLPINFDFFQLTGLKLLEKAVNIFPNALMGIFTFFLFLFLGWICGRFITFFIRHAQKKHVLLNFLLTCNRSFFIVVGTISSLAMMGIDVSALIASLGLGSLAFGLACKDLIANMISGVLLLFYQPFDIEDTVEIKDIRGIVMQIDLRYTTLINENKELCFIPNNNLLTSHITLIRKKGA